MSRHIRFSVIVLVIIIVLSMGGCMDKNVGKEALGLHVSESGTIYLAGNKFYGYGINMFSTFLFHLNNLYNEKYDSKNPTIMNKTAYKDDFALCKAYNIPIVRIPFSTWGVEGYKYFDNDRDRFFKAMDDIVAEAEKNHIGIIASLLWNQDALPYYVQEKRASYGDINSRIMEYAKEYASAIVERYKDSPAIFGWEIGNEYNLCADLTDMYCRNYTPGSIFKVGEYFTFMDYYSSGELQIFYKEIGSLIRSIDPDRMITTGNGENRNFAYASHQSSENMDEAHYWPIDWTASTREQFMEMLDYFTPDPIDTICFHFQHGSLGDENAHLTFQHYLAEGTMDTGEYLKVYVEAGKKYKKGVFFGEFGDFIDMEDPAKGDPEEFREGFKQVMQWMVDADLQIGCGWFNWGRASLDRFNHTLSNMSDVNIFKMDLLSDINKQFAEDGKQDPDAYWSQFPCDGSSFGYTVSD